MSEEKYRVRREVPLFRNLDRVAVSYAFELRNQAAPASGLRARWIHDALRESSPASYEALVEPIRSFLEDVTTGEPGTNGRPLLFAASGLPEDHVSRKVWLHRPRAWNYLFEGQTTRLESASGRVPVELRLRDGFCAFESGRVFYLLTLTQPDMKALPLDEYAVLQLQQLVFQAENSLSSRFLGFSLGSAAGRKFSLRGLAGERLHRLTVKHTKHSAITSVLQPFGLLGTTEEPAAWPEKALVEPGDVPPGNADAAREVKGTLRGMCIGIENEGMLQVAKHADAMFERGAPVDPEPPRPPEMVELESAWGAAKAKAEKPHHEEDGQPDRRTLLAFAGLAQGVPDFPRQDQSEIHDSTRPNAQSVESSLYVHPKFVLEVGKSWRSFDNGRPEIGTCPYLLLMWIVALHDELVVQDMERRLHEIIYDRPPTDMPQTDEERAKRARAEPMASVRRAISGAKGLRNAGTGALEANLTDRLELFRWSSIHQSGKLFRYPKETGALKAMGDALGTNDRFKRAQEKIDKIESLVEDATALKSSYAERRTNWMLIVIALLSIVSMAQDFDAQMEGTPTNWMLGADNPFIFFAAVGLALVTLALIAGPAWHGLKTMARGSGQRVRGLFRRAGREKPSSRTRGRR